MPNQVELVGLRAASTGAVDTTSLCVVDAGRSALSQLGGWPTMSPASPRCGEDCAVRRARMPVAIDGPRACSSEHLQAAGHALFPVSPRIAARPGSGTRSPRSRTTASTPSSSPTPCALTTSGGGRCRCPSALLAEIKALTRDRDRLLETQQAIEYQLRMILEAYHPAPVRLFSSLDRQIALSFVLDYPTPATASRVKTTR